MLARLLLALVAVLLAATAAAQSTDTVRIEALDGGVVDLGGVKQIISQRTGVEILAEGAGSTVNLRALTDVAGMAGAPVSHLEARSGGTLILNPVQTNLGNQVQLSLDPTGILSVGTLQLNPGSRLIGNGSLPGALINGGEVSPGDDTQPAGGVTVQGTYTQTSQGRLRIELGGYTPGSDYDRLTSTGPLTLDGVLEVGVSGDFNPTAGSRFPFVTGAARTGQFATTTGLTLPTGGTLQVEYATATAALAATGSGFPDGTGPEISDARFGATPLANGLIISRPDTLSANAADPSAVARVEFYVDDVLLGADTDGADRYSAFWNIATLPDGAHVVRIVAYDTVNNPSTVTFSMTVQLAVPPAPSIIAPTDGFVTNQASLTILGTAAPDAEILLHRNGIPTSGPFPVAADGGYRGTLTLQPGANTIQAEARNRAGDSPLSAPVGVTLDTTIPDPPTGLTAESQAGGGQIRLSWSVFNNPDAVSYEVYRASAPFTDIAQAVKANSSTLTATRFDDLPPADGVYYYRVVCLNRAGTRSTPSVQVSATADSIAPKAVRIDYTPAGAYDAATGRYGVGDVQVQMTVSEPLLTTPFLSFALTGHAPVAIALNPAGETVYRGAFSVTPSTPSGTTYAVFSARDKVGNRGTVIETGDRLLLDTAGPAVSALSVTPADPIRNDAANPVTVQVRLTLSEAPKAGQPPVLNYHLSAPGRSVEPISLTPLDALNWQGSFLLPADAGQAAVETLEFGYQGVDDLGNVSTAIQAPYRFQVYQGELPPLGPPAGLKATALPQGRIQLQWQAVAKATDYQLYRQAPGESELQAYRRSGGALEWLDTPGVDGLYRYAVASVYQANNQEALSAPSAVVEVQADAVAPAAPRNLQLQLLSTGIQATWEAPADSATLHYNLYRAATPEITSVAGLTPLLSDLTGLSAVDASPSTTEHTYVVTALDPAGNQSPPSNSMYFKPPRLPVASLSVVQQDTAAPVLTWTHPDPDLAGYDLYLGSAESGFKLNDGLLTATTYTDTGYSGDERLYTVVAVGRDNVRSPGRSLLLPKLKVQAPAGAQVRRGLMNQVDYQVSNDSSQAVENATLQVRIGQHKQISQPFTVAAGQTVQAPVVIGGHTDLADLSPVEATLTIEPHPGEQVRIVRTGQLEVTDGALLLQILTQQMTRGGAGKVRFGLENRGTAELEIVVAQAVGSAPSDEIRFTLVDNDGNVLAVQPFQQGAGDGLIGLPDGRTVVRIAPGGRFDSQWIDLPAPSSAPTQAAVELTIDHFHYHLGQPDAVSIEGTVSRQAVSLVDTSYTCELLSVAPEQSRGEQDIVITGRAIERASGTPLPRAPLQLVISSGGFERYFEVYTDSLGGFLYAYKPLPTESGVYRVSCIHPDLRERPEQGRFTIGRVIVDPTQINLNMPRNYDQTVPLQVTVGAGAVATNLRLQYRVQDQPEGQLPPGIQISLSEPLSLTERQTGTLSLTLWADNSAYQTGTLVLRVVSDESGGTPWALIPVKYFFSEAKPALFVSPSYLEMGVARDQSTTGRVILENRGLAEMNEVKLALVDAAGGAPPNWMFLVSPTEQGTLAIGEKRSLDLMANPTATVAEGIYEFKLQVTASNHPTTDINVYVSVTQSGTGHVLFKLSDIYTATLDRNGQRIQGLAGAEIRLQNEQVLSIDRTLTTDVAGEALFNDLPTGNYKYRASAPNHQAVIGRLKIEPGITVTREVFLDYTLVTVEWSVNEIPLEDRYDILLKATYETNVPAPVVLLEPMSVNLPLMQPGEVFYGELTLTNYGLVRADDLKLTLPSTDQYFAYEFQANVPKSLEAKQRITIPYRITSLRGIDQGSEGDASGGGCSTYWQCGWEEHCWECANKYRTCGLSYVCWHLALGSLEQCGGGGPYNGRGFLVGGGGPGGGGGGGVSYSPLPDGCDPCADVELVDCPVCKKSKCVNGEAECEADPEQNGQRCSTDPAQKCRVCEDGKCKRPDDCGAKPVKVVVEVTTPVDAITNVINNAIDLLKTASLGALDLEPSATFNGKVESGEECCDDCRVPGPVMYTDKQVGAAVTLTGQLAAPTKPEAEMSLWRGYRVVAEAGLLAGVEISGSGSANLTGHESFGCDDNSCTKVRFDASQPINGQIGAVAKIALEKRKPGCGVKKLTNDCYELKFGTTSQITGTLSSGFSEFFEVGLAGKSEECNMTDCSISFDGVQFSAVASVEVEIGPISWSVEVSFNCKLADEKTITSCE